MKFYPVPPILLLLLSSGCTEVETGTIEDVHAVCIERADLLTFKRDLTSQDNNDLLSDDSLIIFDRSNLAISTLSNDIIDSNYPSDNYVINVIVRRHGNNVLIASNLNNDFRKVILSGDTAFVAELMRQFGSSGIFYKKEFFSDGASVPIDFCEREDLES